MSFDKVKYKVGKVIKFKDRKKYIFFHPWNQQSCYLCGGRHYFYNSYKNNTVEWHAETWDIEHIVPRSAGGNDEIYNCKISCRKCNAKKSNIFLDYLWYYQNYLSKSKYLYECKHRSEHKIAVWTLYP